MLKYLVILLDDCSVSYCHYDNSNERNLIPLEILHKGILFAMKNDLKIQYVLPQGELPQSYIEVINSMFHDNIGSIGQEEMADVIVVNGMEELTQNENKFDASKRYVIRTTVKEFFERYDLLKNVFERNISVNVLFKDVESFTDDKTEQYQAILNDLGVCLKELILNGGNVNTNILTDRIALDEMNNCGAGDTSITLAPNGKFYPCPAFYYDKDPYCECGSIETGLTIGNKKLFTLEGSPLCKRCDAFHCKRCVWLNKKLTYEVNTPSRQQCVMAHVERNSSKELLNLFHQSNLLKEKEIATIDYIDPFDVYKDL